eukprot:CAMPEP_0194029570 /NCGR_PEP_ID=MMETSP0009_2-20130614/3259_1 /TAXON_ID=210454 /ORGANISM="Grammatophora oceanica, Strain CCMP 410" /LENGTH=69 /DNA_ID=CAMNT_0038669271 /DNA_START=56 /DNA_END=265 /DNA_ORIENTATION=-
MAKLCRSEVEKWSWDQSMETLRYKLYTQARSNFKDRYEQRFWRWLNKRKSQRDTNNQIELKSPMKHQAQ